MTDAAGTPNLGCPDGRRQVAARRSSARISTERLDLVPLGPAFLRASLERNTAAAESIAKLRIPRAWFDLEEYIALRLGQMEVDPSLEEWLIRAIGLRSTRTMVGYLGFHSAPGPEYLKDLSPGGVEFGYTVFADYRRQGYAREATVALMDWAHRAHAVTRFVVSISPENHASLNLASSLGFRKIGAHIDEKDGPEDIFELRWS
jgi:RimJ/RimL family protein N-acetyltransferase